MQDITGSCKLVAFNLGGVYLAFAKNPIELAPEIKLNIETGKEKQLLLSKTIWLLTKMVSIFSD